MIISCPKCETEYNIDEKIIPEAGKKFRCIKCGTVWLVEKSLKPAITDDFTNDEKIDNTVEGDTKIQEEILPEVPSEENTIIEKVEIDSEKDETEHQNNEEELSQTNEEVPDFKNEIEELPDQFKEFNSSVNYIDEENQSKVGKSKAPFILFIISCLIALYIGRFYIVEKYPPLQPFYETIGVSFDVAGEGLSFQKIRKEKLIVDDINYLVVNGVIINESNKVRDVPNIALFLFDDKKKLIQKTTIRPDVTSLTPGETADFMITIEAPSVMAIEANISFVEAKGKKNK